MGMRVPWSSYFFNCSDSVGNQKFSSQVLNIYNGFLDRVSTTNTSCFGETHCWPQHFCFVRLLWDKLLIIGALVLRSILGTNLHPPAFLGYLSNPRPSLCGDGCAGSRKDKQLGTRKM